MLFIAFIVVVPLTLYKIMMMIYKLISKQDDTVHFNFKFIHNVLTTLHVIAPERRGECCKHNANDTEVTRFYR